MGLEGGGGRGEGVSLYKDRLCFHLLVRASTSGWDCSTCSLVSDERTRRPAGRWDSAGGAAGRGVTWTWTVGCYCFMAAWCLLCWVGGLGGQVYRLRGKSGSKTGAPPEENPGVAKSHEIISKFSVKL